MDPKDEYGKEALRLIEEGVAGDETDARITARIAEAQVYATLEVARQIILLRSEQLARVIMRKEDVMCDACGESYTPRRMTPPGQKRYCTRKECQAHGAKLRKRRQRDGTAKKRRTANRKGD